MPTSIRHSGIAAAAAMAAFGVSAQTLTPQDSASEMYFDVSTGLYYYDNYEGLVTPTGPTTLVGTDLIFGYNSETRYQTLSFETGIRFEFGDYGEDPSTTSQWVDPFAVLDYSRESSTALFATTLSYRERDNGIDVIEDFQSSTDLIVDQGTRSDARVTVALETGIGTPVRSSMELYYNQRRFYDTTDPDLTDQDLFSFAGEVGLAINRSSELLLVAEYWDRDDLDDINDDEVNTTLGVGISTYLAPDLTFRGVVNYEWDERTRTVGGERVEELQESPTLDLSFVKDRPNGNLRFSLGSELDSNGVRTTAEVGRAMELPHGAIDLSVGATRLADGTINPVGALAWDRTYKTRALALDYTSSVVTNDDGNDILRNRLAFQFSQEFTEIDRFVLDMNYYATEGLDDPDDDEQRFAVDLSYFRDINRNLAFVTGVRHVFDSGDNQGDVTENEVFARIDKRFSLRP